MGKADCEENRQLSEAICLNNVAANAIRKLKSGKANRILSDTISAHQGAIVELIRVQKEHQQGCGECQKGD